jgi:serine/threonine protein phosphatase PrpC
MDECFIEKTKASSIEDTSLIDDSGTSALILFVYDDKLILANLGMSKAIISKDEGNRIFSLNIQHKLNNSKEEQRIKRLGGQISAYIINQALSWIK